MARHAIARLVGERPDQTVVFGGTSAGGRGAMATIDFVKEVVPESTVVRGMLDSPGYQVSKINNIKNASDTRK
jgi:hypothetical protein